MIEIDKAMRDLIEATIAIAAAQKRQAAAIHAMADAVRDEPEIDWRVVRLWGVKLEAANLAIENMKAASKAAQGRLNDLCWAHGAGGNGEAGQAAAGG